eukprot:5195774-Amphidinium_carterae.1
MSVCGCWFNLTPPHCQIGTQESATFSSKVHLSWPFCQTQGRSKTRGPNLAQHPVHTLHDCAKLREQEQNTTSNKYKHKTHDRGQVDQASTSIKQPPQKRVMKLPTL